VVPYLCHLAALYGTVSGCRRATPVSRHAHFSFISRLLYLFFFDIFPSNQQIFWSTYCSGLDRLYDSDPGVGTCIQRYRDLNVLALICRWRTYRTACTNELLDLCITFVNE